MAGHVARKGDRWYAVVYEGTDPQTGRERRRWHPAGTDRTAAEELAERLATDAARRLSEQRTGLTVESFITRWWLPGKQRRLSPTTLNGYQRNLRLHILPVLGDMLLVELRPEHAEDLYAHLLESGRADGSGGLSAKTVREVHLLLRSIGDEAVRRGKLSSNPIRLATGPRFRRDHQRRRMAWNAAELGRFLQEAQGHVHHRSFWLAAHTGMRRGELLGLRWRDIDLDRARLTIARGIVCIGGQLVKTPGKTPSSARTIDIDDTTVDVLRRWRDDQRDRWRADGQPVELFAKPDGDLLHPQTLSQAFDRVLARTDLPPITLHGLRHTHATLLLRAGVPLKVVSERLGHSHPAFTMATYQHVLPGMQADAAATFAALLSEAA